MSVEFEAAKKRLEQIKKSNKLYQSNNATKKDDVFFKPAEEKKTIRILARKDWPTPLFETAYHFDIGGQKLYCPQKNQGEECPICDFYKKLRMAKDDKASKVESRWAYTAIIVERKKDGSFDKPKLWTFSSGKIYEDFITKLGDEDYQSYLSYGKDGWDWRVQKVLNENPNAFTKYRIECIPYKSSVLTDDPDVIKELEVQIKELEDFYIERLMKPLSTEAIRDVFNKWVDGVSISATGTEEATQEKIDEIANIVDKVKF